MSRVKAYCELVRLPNLFTAVADILGGYFFVVQEAHLSVSLILLIVATCCLYATGIIVNDLRDIEIDRRERPTRPLPSARVSIAAAKRLALVLSVFGVLAATLASSPLDPLAAFALSNRTGPIALCLLAAIFLYDLVLKESPLGPVAMGLCRALNLAMPLSLATFNDGGNLNMVIALVVSYGLYVASFTYFGRNEAGTIRRRPLIAGYVGVMLAVLAIGTICISISGFDRGPLVIWFGIAFHLYRIGRRTLRSPSPEMVRYTMKTFILCIIAINALIASTMAGLTAALIVLALLIPALFIGKWVYST